MEWIALIVVLAVAGMWVLARDRRHSHEVASRVTFAKRPLLNAEEQAIYPLLVEAVSYLGKKQLVLPKVRAASILLAKCPNNPDAGVPDDIAHQDVDFALYDSRDFTPQLAVRLMHGEEKPAPDDPLEKALAESGVRIIHVATSPRPTSRGLVSQVKDALAGK